MNISSNSIENTPPTSPYKKKVTIAIVAVIGILAVVLFATVYSDYLGAKVAPGRKFKILGPSTLTAGQMATITWDASTEGVARYPYEKIEYCIGKAVRQKCTLLASAVPNNGKAVVKVPASLPAGRGYLKLTARDTDKKLVGSLVSSSGTVAARRASSVVVSSSEPSDDGGSSGGSGSSSSNSNSENPRAEFIAPLDSEQVLLGDNLDVLVQLTKTTGTSLGCQQWKLNGHVLTVNDWVGGQSPDLSAEPCN